MAKNTHWLFNIYDQNGILLGDLIGTDVGHALEEAGHVYLDEALAGREPTKAVRIRGSGMPNKKLPANPRSPLGLKRLQQACDGVEKLLRAYTAGQPIETMMGAYGGIEKRVVDAAREFLDAAVHLMPH